MTKKGLPPDIADENEKTGPLLIHFSFEIYAYTYCRYRWVHHPLFPAHAIDYLLLDSRKVYSPASSLFFALKGLRRDGHQFIAELYKKGVRSFVVSEEQDASSLSQCFILFW